MRKLLLLSCALLITAPGFAGLRSGSESSNLKSAAERNASFRTGWKRKESAKKQFMRQTGYPKGRKGYVVDYIVPRSKGGMDHPANMQWLKKADAKAKHKRERAQHW